MNETLRRLASAAILAAALVGSVLSALAGESTFGKGVTLKETTRISDLYSAPDKFVGKEVRVEGTITDVCSKRGCWMQIASDKEFQTLRFKVEDGVIVIPMEAKGKKAVAQGKLAKSELSKEQALEQAKHFAEENGKPFDPKSVTGPQTVLTLHGTGAVIQ